MYKLAALTCVAISVFAFGITHLSDKQVVHLTPFGIDFQSQSVMGTFVVRSTNEKEIKGSLKIFNRSDLPIRLDLSEFVVAVGRQSGALLRLPSADSV